MQEIFDHIGGPEFTQAEQELARPFLDPDAPVDTPLFSGVEPTPHARPQRTGSTDVGDVSWVVPTIQCNVAAVAQGTPGHSWLMVAQGRATYAHRALSHSARVLSATIVELATDLEVRERACAEHRELTSRHGYEPLVRDDARPVGARPASSARDSASSSS